MSVLILNTQNFDQEVVNFNGVVLVDFYADWCGPCRMIAPEIEMLSQQFANDSRVKIGKVNVDENEELAGRYNIRGIPNVIIFKNGIVAKQIVGIPAGNGNIIGLSKTPAAIYKAIIEELLKAE